LFERYILDGDSLVVISSGTAYSNIDVLENGWADKDIKKWYEWFDYTINGETATLEEFNNEFGIMVERGHLNDYTITEANIQGIVFGWRPIAVQTGALQESFDEIRDKCIDVLLINKPFHIFGEYES